MKNHPQDIITESPVMGGEKFCMDLVKFLTDNPEYDWGESFAAMNRGECPFKDRCDRYERTMHMKRHGKQLIIKL